MSGMSQASLDSLEGLFTDIIKLKECTGDQGWTLNEKEMYGGMIAVCKITLMDIMYITLPLFAEQLTGTFEVLVQEHSDFLLIN